QAEDGIRDFHVTGVRRVLFRSPLLVVDQVGDAGLGVLELGAPEERLERADLDADAAVHAERVVDREAVEVVDLAGLPALAAGRESGRASCREREKKSVGSTLSE